MGKFFKQGKVVIVTSGRYAGRKGIIVQANYGNSKDRKYPHCLIVGLSKFPRKATKRSLKKMEARIKDLEKKQEDKKDKDKENIKLNTVEKLRRLKSLGIFMKTYNMAHLLVTRYSIKEDFGANQGLENLEKLENDVKETQAQLKKLTDEKKEENKKAIEDLQKTLGEQKDKYKQTLREVKCEVGSQMYNRFMEGFPKSNNAEENEKQEHAEFLFKKLNF